MRLLRLNHRIHSSDWLCLVAILRLISVQSATSYEILGETLDDAVGEAFDKVASMLGLPYPGGPEIERVAEKGDSKAVPFTIPLEHEDTIQFSFARFENCRSNLCREGITKTTRSI